MRKFIVWLASLSAALFIASTTTATTTPHFTELDRYLGQGEAIIVPLEDDFTFQVNSFGNHFQFYINNFVSASSPDEYRWWALAMAAPFDQMLAVQKYPVVIQFPFQDNVVLSLFFFGNGGGDN